MLKTLECRGNAKERAAVTKLTFHYILARIAIEQMEGRGVDFDIMELHCLLKEAFTVMRPDVPADSQRTSIANILAFRYRTADNIELVLRRNRVTRTHNAVGGNYRYYIDIPIYLKHFGDPTEWINHNLKK